MSDRQDYFFRQKVTEAELDLGFNGLEVADFNLAIDHELTGIVNGQGVGEASVPDLTVDVAAGTNYSKQGERTRNPSTQNVDMSQDDGATSTAVATPGNQKIVSLFMTFDRALSDPRIDGNSLTVFFERDESFDFSVVQGAEAVGAAAVPPPLDGNKILLADIRLEFGTTTITNAGTIFGSPQIDTSRREDAYKFTGGTIEITEGSANDAIASLLTALNQHVDGAANKHPAADIDYAGTGTWLDGVTNPAASVEAQLDKLKDDLGNASGSGATKLSIANSVATLGDGSTINPVPNHIRSFLELLIGAIGGATGAEKIGTNAIASSPSSLAGVTVDAQVVELLSLINARARLAGTNVFSGSQTFDTPIILGPVATEADLLGENLQQTPPDPTVTAWEYNKILEVVGNANLFTVRIWSASTLAEAPDDGIYISINADYNGSVWNKDDTALLSRLYAWGSTGIRIKSRPIGAGTWADNAWDTEHFSSVMSTSGETSHVLNNGNIRLGANTGTNTNPLQAATPLTNTVYSKNTVKAWGFIEVSAAGAINIDEGFNFSVAAPGSAISMVVSFRVAVSDADYAVVTSVGDLISHIEAVHTPTTAQFQLARHVSSSGAALARDTSGTHHVAFVVLGTNT